MNCIPIWDPDSERIPITAMTDKRHRALLLVSFPPSIPTLATTKMEPKADMCDAATINVIMEEIKCPRTKDNEDKEETKIKEKEDKEETKIKEKEDTKIPREKRKNVWCLGIVSVTFQRVCSIA